MCSQKLKTIRSKHNLTQTQAANIVHISQRNWARYEAGTLKPPAGIVELFCLKLGEKYES